MNSQRVALRILLIEDDIDDYMFFRDALSETGLNAELQTTTRCNNILDVLGPSADSLPQIIFLDLHMPLVSGRECLHSIRSLQHLDAVPVVIYSTSASAYDIEDTWTGGADLYLTKPSSFQLLVSALRKILQLNWKIHALEKNRQNFVYKHSVLNQAAA